MHINFLVIDMEYALKNYFELDIFSKEMNYSKYIFGGSARYYMKIFY